MEPLLDEFGLVTPSGMTSQNGILFSSYYLAALDAKPMMIISAAENCCWAGLRRSPVSCEPEGPDNHVGLGYMAHLGCNLIFENVILNLALDRWIMKDATCDGYKIRVWYRRWLGRFPHVCAHLLWSIGREPNLFQKIYWYAAIFLTCYSKKEKRDAWLMVMLMLQVHQAPWLEKHYWARVKKIHGSLANCMREWLVVDESHFMAQAFKRFD